MVRRATRRTIGLRTSFGGLAQLREPARFQNRKRLGFSTRRAFAQARPDVLGSHAAMPKLDRTGADRGVVQQKGGWRRRRSSSSSGFRRPLQHTPASDRSRCCSPGMITRLSSPPRRSWQAHASSRTARRAAMAPVPASCPGWSRLGRGFSLRLAAVLPEPVHAHAHQVVHDGGRSSTLRWLERRPRIELHLLLLASHRRDSRGEEVLPEVGGGVAGHCPCGLALRAGPRDPSSSRGRASASSSVDQFSARPRSHRADQVPLHRSRSSR